MAWSENKTYKREVATAQLVLWWTLVGYTMYSISHHDATISAQVTNLTITLAFYVWGFALAAFGVDTAYKQVIPALKEK